MTADPAPPREAEMWCVYGPEGVPVMVAPSEAIARDDAADLSWAAKRRGYDRAYVHRRVRVVPVVDATEGA